MDYEGKLCGALPINGVTRGINRSLRIHQSQVPFGRRRCFVLGCIQSAVGEHSSLPYAAVYCLLKQFGETHDRH